MPLSKIRDGSLQFWPRKRAEKILPSANWNALQKTLDKQEKKQGVLNGFIGYKVGMVSVYAKDNTPDSVMKGKKIIVPASILECPKMKILSVRFYKNGQVVKDLIVNWEKDLKAKVKKPQNLAKLENLNFEYDDIRIVAYPKVSDIELKKSPEIIEISLNGTKEEKLAFVKEKMNKEISVSEVFKEGVVDIRGVTRGFGLQGPVKRFGIGLKSHKSEKGVRRPGSLGPWHPAHTTFRTPISGQTGFFTRVAYNNLILKISNVKELNLNEIKKGGFDNYGILRGDFILLKGSVQGTKKRPLLITNALRPTKKTTKQKLEFIEAR
jgi:large subunit ribosomal protein L3